MRRGRIFFYLAFILILGLVVVFFVMQRMKPQATQAQQPASTPAVDLVNVVVLTQKVQRGAMIKADVVGTVAMPRDLMISGMYDDTQQVIGRQARFDLDSGILMTNGMLVDQSAQLSTTGSVAALSIPRGMVAVSIPINRLSSISYGPQPGDHVNVIVSLLLVDLDPDFQTKLPNDNALILAPGPITPENGPTAVTAYLQEGSTAGRAEVDPVLGQTVYLQPSASETMGQRPRLTSQTLLQDVVVLQVGEFSQQQAAASAKPASDLQTVSDVQTTPAAPGDGLTQTAADKKDQPEVITLIVTPQDAVTLNYLMYMHAGLTLALRSSGDDSKPETEAVTMQFLMDQYNLPLPVKLPYGIEPAQYELSLPEVPTPTPAP